jgi:hypothetical protein
VLGPAQIQVSVIFVEGFTGVHKSMRMQNIVFTKDALQGAVDNGCIEDLLQLRDSWQHVVSHVEFARIVPLDPGKDLLVNAGWHATIKHQNPVTDELAKLLVVEF